MFTTTLYFQLSKSNTILSKVIELCNRWEATRRSASTVRCSSSPSPSSPPSSPGARMRLTLTLYIVNQSSASSSGKLFHWLLIEIHSKEEIYCVCDQTWSGCPVLRRSKLLQVLCGQESMSTDRHNDQPNLTKPFFAQFGQFCNSCDVYVYWITNSKFQYFLWSKFNCNRCYLSCLNGIGPQIPWIVSFLQREIKRHDLTKKDSPNSSHSPTMGQWGRTTVRTRRWGHDFEDRRLWDRRLWGQTTLRQTTLRTDDFEDRRLWGQATLRTGDFEDKILKKFQHY